MAKTKFPAPDSLATAGAEVWLKITAAYDLRPDELATLEDACTITDMIAALTSVWVEAGRPVTTLGSMGQQVIHPLIGEIRTQKMARNSLWRQLKLPDLAGDGAESAGANPARKAAQSRWAAAHGAGA